MQPRGFRNNAAGIIFAPAGGIKPETRIFAARGHEEIRPGNCAKCLLGQTDTALSPAAFRIFLIVNILTFRGVKK
jgi:hypothetical protein